MKLQESYVFTGVCLSKGGAGHVNLCHTVPPRTEIPQTETSWTETIWGPPKTEIRPRTDNPTMSTAAGRTHHTGMQSCYFLRLKTHFCVLRY